MSQDKAAPSVVPGRPMPELLRLVREQERECRGEASELRLNAEQSSCAYPRYFRALAGRADEKARAWAQVADLVSAASASVPSRDARGADQ